MTGTPVGVLLALALAAPPAAPPAPPDRQLSFEAEQFARSVIRLAEKVSDEYARPTPVPDLLAAAMEATYEAAGRRLPADIRRQLLKAKDPGDQLRAVTEARTALGRQEALAGMKGFVTAVNGFARATDPYNGLTWDWSNRTSAASSDVDFRSGFELEGVTAARWIAYLLDAQRSAEGGPAHAPPPIGSRWEVRRIIPGSPAAKAGLRPGDVITHAWDEEVTPESNAALFRRLAAAALPDIREPGTTVDFARPIPLTVRRPGAAEPVTLSVPRTDYTPESVFGVLRRTDGTWDYWLDRQARIGYIRLGAVENPAPAAFDTAMATLTREGAAGLILDLRWCPGGFVAPTIQICGMLLPAGAKLATVQARHPERHGGAEYTAQPGPSGRSYLDIPLAVLVGPDTIGGGELIAAAIQDHSRGVLVGSRTFGKANLMQLINLSNGLAYRYSYGFTLRPNGRPRHRFPDSKPTDEWGVKPDKGYEIPLTPELSAKLRQEADLQALRPAGDFKTVPFDDPLADPQRLLAVKWLTERIRGSER